MKSDNIKRIMAFAKAQKPMYKIVISVVDVVKDGDTIETEHRPGTKYICTDEFNNTIEVDELDNNLTQEGETLFLNVTSIEMADAIRNIANDLQ